MNDKKTSKNREKKEQIVAQLAEKAGKAKNLIFADYQGLTHKQIEQLKKKLKAANADLVVTKNTLLKLALGKTTEEDLMGPTATVFIYEEPIQALKEIAKTIKELKLPNLKFGIIDGARLSGEELIKLSTLPSKEVLLAQFVGGLKSPIFGLHRALNWNLQKLVMTLKAVENSKGVN